MLTYWPWRRPESPIHSSGQATPSLAATAARDPFSLPCSSSRPSPCCSIATKVEFRWTRSGQKVRVSKRTGNVVRYPKIADRYTQPLRPAEPGPRDTPAKLALSQTYKPPAHLIPYLSPAASRAATRPQVVAARPMAGSASIFRERRKGECTRQWRCPVRQRACVVLCCAPPCRACAVACGCVPLPLHVALSLPHFTPSRHHPTIPSSHHLIIIRYLGACSARGQGLGSDEAEAAAQEPRAHRGQGGEGRRGDLRAADSVPAGDCCTGSGEGSKGSGWRDFASCFCCCRRCIGRVGTGCSAAAIGRHAGSCGAAAPSC